MIKYYKLFDLLNRRGMKKTDLLEHISSPTLAKLGKGESVNTSVIDKICTVLNCQPGDIMEWEVRMKKIDKAIMLLRSIPEDKLDAVIEFLIAFTIPVKCDPSKQGDIIDFSARIPEDSRE